MISIKRASLQDVASIVFIGNISVEAAHRDSCSARDMQEYLEKNYSVASITKELADPENIYHIIYYNEQPAGFSKIVLDAAHPNIAGEHVTKLDRIYLLEEYQQLKLGSALLQFNIDLAKNEQQTGIWLFTWVGNSRAVNFYLKKGFSVIGSHMFKVSENHSNENHQMLLDLTGN